MRIINHRIYGLTLIELMIAVIMFVIIVVVTAYVFRAVLLGWASTEEKRGIDIVLYRGMEEVVRDLREATELSSVNNDEIRFTHDAVTYYIYYLYNSDDSYPPTFGESDYELRRAQLTGGINGTFTYGSGKLIMTDVVPPATSDLSISGDVVTIDLNVTRDNETVRSRTEVAPRNL